MTPPQNAWLHRIESPLGPLLASANLAGELVYLGFEAHDPREALLREGTDRTRDAGLLDPLRRQLEEYFGGRRRAFDLPLDLRGTPFRRRVWEELRRVPFGEVISYGALATRLGDARLCRAVGAANGANPVSIVVPCHRVLGADGGLTGYAGGIPRKAALLAIEGVKS